MSDVKILNGYDIKDEYARRKVDANTGSSGVRIAGRGAVIPSGGYVFPNDGYVIIKSSAMASEQMMAEISSSNSVVVAAITITKSSEQQSVFVKKGMKLTGFKTIGGTGTQTEVLYSAIT